MDEAALECNGAGGAPPVTLGEFTLNGDGGKDFYDIISALLMGLINIPLSITPDGGCSSTSCSADVNSVCPPQLSVKGGPGGNTVVACNSACQAFKEDQYCCLGDFSEPPAGRCKPTDYSRIFKNACPQAYSYAKDDPSSTFTCATGANYAVTFCP